jgi:ubiquinone/menaquinone biosynthesis C-methylase UbiE
MSEGEHYLPVRGLSIYDPLTKLIGADRAREALLTGAALQGSERVLDVGCGTGTLAVLVKSRFPDAAVFGIDPDPKAIRRARRKAERAGLTVRFDEAFANKLPYDDRSFDRVFSSMMFHHLGEGKLDMLREVRRVLAPGGSFHMLDFGGTTPPTNPMARLFVSMHHLRENFGTGIVELMRNAGFADPQQTGQGKILTVPIACFACRIPQ